MSDDWIVLARVARPQGRRGEVLCDLFTDFPERFAERRSLFLLKKDGQISPVMLEDFWLPTGNSAGRVVLKFNQSSTIADAEAMVGQDIVLPVSQRVTLDADTFYVSDLQGCVVVNLAGGDGPDELGTITDVHFPTNTAGKRLENAAPLLVVSRANGDEVLIPLALEFLQHPDLKNRRLEMHLPLGLVEANG